MFRHTTFQAHGKKILAVVGIGLGAISFHAGAQTLEFTNDGGSGEHVWNVGINWDPVGPPTFDDFASVSTSIDGPLPNELFITNGSTLTSANAAVGTLTLIGGNQDPYIVRATGAGRIFGHTAAPATLTFGAGGQNPVAGALDYFGDDETLIFGGTASAEGTLTIAVPHHLRIRTGGVFNVVDTWGRIDGSGSVTLSLLPNESIAHYLFGNVISHKSTYSGGTTLDAGGTLQINASSEQSSGSIMVNGPIGVGTCYLNGGTMFFHSAGSFTLGNDIALTAHSGIVTKADDVTLLGDIRTNGYRLTMQSVASFQSLLFDDAGWSSTDTGTLSFVSGSSVGIDVNTGATAVYGGYVGERVSGAVNGSLAKTGAGTFETRHVRVSELDISGGTFKITNTGSLESGDNTGPSTSVVNSVSVSGAKLDLGRNELIVDYSGSSPIGTPSTSGSIAAMIASAFTSGTWGGNGITSSDANSTTRALGYAEASAFSHSTFGGLSVDSTAVLIGFTRYGDANLDGNTNMSDFSIMASNFGESGIWQDGDFNYDGSITIADQALLSSELNWQQTPDLLARGGLPLLDLYIAMLDYPNIYWESRLWPELWERFEPYEAMNLGPIPPVPAYLLARGIPEPAGATAIAAAAALLPRRRRSRRP